MGPASGPFMLVAFAIVAFQTPRIDAASFRRAVEYSAEAKGLSLLVMENGKITHEAYSNGHSADRAHLLASGTKSFTGVMAMAAQEDGLLKLDERVSDTITEWKGDPRKGQMTIRQLLTLTGGLEHGTIGRPPSYDEAIKARSLTVPGRRFAYGPTPFQAFGALMTRKLKPRNESVYDYLTRRILEPIGAKPRFWQGQRTGEIQLPSGAYFTAREWVKFGEAMRLNGRGVLKPGSVAEMVKGTTANPGYGLTWWLNKPGTLAPTGGMLGGGQFWPGGPADAYMAAGAANQRLYIVPSLRTVVVRQGRQADFSDAELLKRLFR